MSFGENLEQLMMSKNLSVNKLAKELNVPAKTVQEWVGAGGRMPRNPEVLRKLAIYFKCSIHFLLFGEEDRLNSVASFLDKIEIHSGLYEVSIKKIIDKADK